MKKDSHMKDSVKSPVHNAKVKSAAGGRRESLPKGGGAAIGSEVAAKVLGADGQAGRKIGSITPSVSEAAPASVSGFLSDPYVGDAFWKSNFRKQPYVNRGAVYVTYQLAYKTGYEGREQFPGKDYEEVEVELKQKYETQNGGLVLDWEEAKFATRDAWGRVEALRIDTTPANQVTLSGRTKTVKKGAVQKPA